MKMPKAGAKATAIFESLLPTDRRVQARKMFGQPAAFGNGHMFFGVFGDQVFLRLSEADQAEANGIAGVAPFEPMAGRPMRGYLVFPASVLSNRSMGPAWVEKALRHVLTLPPKKPAVRKG